jgi:hypothetical protein
MKNDWVFYVLVGFLFMILFIFIMCLSALKCTRWEDSGFNSKFIPFKGCLVEVAPNKWMPAENVREIAK